MIHELVILMSHKCHMHTNNILKNLNIENYSNNQDINKIEKSPYFYILVIFWILALIVIILTMVVSGMVAYKCNKHENGLVQFFVVLFAILFHEFYIPYYLIKRVIMHIPCYPRRNHNRYNR